MPIIKLSKNFIRSACRLALNEDLFPSGDITSNLLKNNLYKKVKIKSNQKGVLGGLDFAKETFKLIDKKIKFTAKKKEVFKETAATVKYFFDFKPFLGDTHPAGLRTKEEAIKVQEKIKTAFKEACEAGDKEACSPSKHFTLEYLK